MSAPEILRAIAAKLDAADIPFMLTGSVAAALYGAGRATMDIDLVIDAAAEQIQRLVASLSGAETYVSIAAALEALRHESMFNVVDTTTGWKADLIIRKSQPFSEMELSRRRAMEFEGTRLWVAAAPFGEPPRWRILAHRIAAERDLRGTPLRRSS